MNVFTRILEEYAESGMGAGVSARITHKGEDIYRGAAGYADIEAQKPFTCGDVIRIYSLSKMVNAVAALKLFEQGYFSLDDPVHTFVPAFREAKVLSYFNRDVPVIKPAKNDVTMRHLFTMTAGYTYPQIAVMAETPRRYMDAASHSAKLFARMIEERDGGETLTTKKMVEALAEIPMCFEPGEGFVYGLCADILGGVIEAICGKKLGQYMHDEIFAPLGMKDTTFNPNEEQRERAATIYNCFDPANVAPFTSNGFKSSIERDSDGHLEICIGGLYSTLDDYSAFIQMLGNGGTYAGNRILGRKTVELMTMDHLTDVQYADFKTMWSPRGNASWGLMTRVTTSLKDSPHAFFPGTFGWGGAAGTLAVADPAEGLTLTLMTQRVPSHSYGVMTKLAQAAYATID